MSAELWALEEQFWTGGHAFYDKHLASEAVMTFPAPAGILTREAILRSLLAAPRWRTVEMQERRVIALGAAAVALVYEAKAMRSPAGQAYRAFTSSVYRRRPGGWELVFHQQTPR